MNKFVQSAVIVTALYGAVANLPSAAYAQAATPDAATARAQDRVRTPRLPSERIEARLAYMKTALKITPAQESQWNALANVLRNQAKAMDGEIAARRATASATQTPSTAIERLEHRQQFMSTAAARMGEVLTAAKPLYASFTPDQQKTADDLLSRGSRSRHGHRSH